MHSIQTIRRLNAQAALAHEQRERQLGGMMAKLPRAQQREHFTAETEGGA